MEGHLSLERVTKELTAVANGHLALNRSNWTAYFIGSHRQGPVFVRPRGNLRPIKFCPIEKVQVVNKLVKP